MDEGIGQDARLPRRSGPRREHHRHLLLRPGLLPRRARLVRQTLDVRGVLPDALPRPLARRDQARLRLAGPHPEHRLRPDLPRALRRRRSRPTSRAAAWFRSCSRSGEKPADWRDALYYATTARPPTTSPPTTASAPRRHKLFYLPEHRRMATLRPEEGSAGDESRSTPTRHTPQSSSDMQGQSATPFAGEYRAHSALLPAHRNNSDWWKTRHGEEARPAREHAHDLLFIGDSITQGWEGAGKEIWDKFYGPRKPSTSASPATAPSTSSGASINGELAKQQGRQGRRRS